MTQLVRPMVESLNTARLRLGGLGYHGEARDMASAMAQANKVLAALQWIVDHGDIGAGRRPAYHDMRAKAREAIEIAHGRAVCSEAADTGLALACSMRLVDGRAPKGFRALPFYRFVNA